MWARQQRLRRDRERVDQPVERRGGSRATVSTDSVAGFTPITASPQPKSRPSTADEQDAAEVVGRVVRLDADAEHAALAHRVAAAGDDRGSCSRPATRSLLLISLATAAAISGVIARCSGRRSASPVVRRRAGTRGTRRRSGRGAARRPSRSSASRISRLTSSSSGSMSGLSTISASVTSARTSLAATRSRSVRAAMPGELVARLLLVRLGEHLAQVGEAEPLAADDGRQVHAAHPDSELNRNWLVLRGDSRCEAITPL